VTLLVRGLFIGVGVVLLLAQVALTHPAEVPRIRMENGAGQLVVDGRAFLVWGGELGNSSAGMAAEAEAILPKLAAMQLLRAKAQIFAAGFL
jgi:hypothetical protein